MQPVAAHQPTPSATPAAQTTAAAPTPAAPANRQILNTTRVGIDYHVGRVGPSGVSKVEVWATQDRGQTWQRVGEDTTGLPRPMLLGVGDLVEPVWLARNHQVEDRRTSGRALPDGVEQRFRRGGLVGNDEDVGRLCHE